MTVRPWRPVSRRRPARRHRLAPAAGMAGVFVLLAGGMTVLGGAAWSRLHRAQALAVRSVRVEGLRRLDPAPLRALVIPLQGRPLAGVSTDGLRSQIEALPGVESAVVGKVLPDTLAITVVEKPAVGVILRPDGAALVDATGARIGPAAADAPLPRLDDLTPDGAAADPALAGWAAGLAGAPDLAARVIELRAEPGGTLALTRDGLRLRLPEDPAELPAAAARLAALNPAALPGWGPGARIDLRFPGEVWYLPPPGTPKSPDSTPSPAPQEPHHG